MYLLLFSPSFVFVRFIVNIIFLNAFQTLAKHVINVHMNAAASSVPVQEGELSLNSLKKFIAFCKATYVFVKSATVI